MRSVALSLLTALLLSIADGGVFQINPTHNAFAQVSSTATATGCQQLPITEITPSGDDCDAPANVLDNNFNTGWSSLGIGSWFPPSGNNDTIQPTLRSNMWSAFGPLVGNLLGDPALSSNPDGRLEVFLVESDHTPYQNSELSGSLYDNFEGGKYTLSGGQTSPNGKWLDNFNGFGSAGVQDNGTGTNNVFFETPAVSTSTSQTHSTLVTSTQKWGNLELDMDVKTVHQLRQNSSPNPWEVAWIFFRQTDTFHYYVFMVKPNGIEFDKKDCNTCTDPVQGQQILVTVSSPTLKIGGWSHWKITAIGNHITISVDGNKVIDYVDQTMSQQLSSGAIAMYTEDANVNFDNVFVTPQ